MPSGENLLRKIFDLLRKMRLSVSIYADRRILLVSAPFLAVCQTVIKGTDRQKRISKRGLPSF